MAKQKILIADDEAQIREILRIYFEKEGFQVIETEDGAAAILKVQSEKPDILLLDIMMPVLDGIEVCKQVRKMSDLPIIMVTAKDDDDERIAGLEIGADDYITKVNAENIVISDVTLKAVGANVGGIYFQPGTKAHYFTVKNSEITDMNTFYKSVSAMSNNVVLTLENNTITKEYGTKGSGNC